MSDLPAYIDLRRDTMAREWIFICRACGVKERYHSFWFASQAAHDHADVENLDLDRRVEPAQLRWLGPQAGGLFR